MKLNLAWVVAAATATVVACATTDETVSAPGDADAGTSTPIPAPEDAGVTTPPSGPVPDAGQGDSGKPTEAAVCGDGKVGTGEQCDDGNDKDGDGCSPTCKIESAGPNDVCPGVAIPLTGTGGDPRVGTISGATAGTYGQTAGSCGGATGKDAVYSVTSDVTGILTAKLTSSFDSVLYARRTCDDTATEAACNDAPGTAGGETIKLPITKGEPVFLFVDGFSGSAGTFKIDVDIATAFCGNGVAEPPETCDDGNSVAGDGCAADCSIEGSANDDIKDCPGQAISLTADATGHAKISIAGSTATMPTNTLSSNGCSAAGPNAIYAVTADVDGAMTARLVAGYDNATIHMRAECDTTASTTDAFEFACAEATDPLQPIEITAPARKGVATFLVIDSTSSTYKGNYTVEVSVRPGVCGNNQLEGGEDCDDGNSANGDGCSSTCKLEPLPLGVDVCPGYALPLVAAGDGSYTALMTSSTTTLTSDYKPKKAVGGCSTSTAAKDAVFVVTSPINGLLRATVVGNFDTAIYARTECVADDDDSLKEDLGCSGSDSDNGPESVAVPIEANKPLYVIVDAESASDSGQFRLDVAVTPAVCGNDFLEGGEQCDDANAVGGDGCSATCQLETVTGHDTCGNAETITLLPNAGGTGFSASVSSGTTNLAHNQSFAAGTGCTGSTSGAGADAMFKVKAEIDGVLRVEIPVASFDVSLGARTSSTCPAGTGATQPLVCSNQTSDDGSEQVLFPVKKDEIYFIIVDSPKLEEKGAFTMLLNLTPSGCGDTIKAGTEQCDDGNLDDGDGCSSTCTIEALAGIDTCPGYTLNLSGTGTEPRTGVLTIDTTNLTQNYAGTCGGNAKDGVVVVTPPIDGRLAVKLTGIDYAPLLHVRTTCGDVSTQKGCDDDQPALSTPSRDLTISGVKAGTPYYIIIDGFNGGAGVARLNVTVTP